MSAGKGNIVEALRFYQGLIPISLDLSDAHEIRKETFTRDFAQEAKGTPTTNLFNKAEDHEFSIYLDKSHKDNPHKDNPEVVVVEAFPIKKTEGIGGNNCRALWNALCYNTFFSTIFKKDSELTPIRKCKVGFCPYPLLSIVHANYGLKLSEVLSDKPPNAYFVTRLNKTAWKVKIIFGIAYLINRIHLINITLREMDADDLKERIILDQNMNPHIFDFSIFAKLEDINNAKAQHEKTENLFISFIRKCFSKECDKKILSFVNENCIKHFCRFFKIFFPDFKDYRADFKEYATNLIGLANQNKTYLNFPSMYEICELENNFERTPLENILIGSEKECLDYARTNEEEGFLKSKKNAGDSWNALEIEKPLTKDKTTAKNDETTYDDTNYENIRYDDVLLNKRKIAKNMYKILASMGNEKAEIEYIRLKLKLHEETTDEELETIVDNFKKDKDDPHLNHIIYLFIRNGYKSNDDISVKLNENYPKKHYLKGIQNLDQNNEKAEEYFKASLNLLKPLNKNDISEIDWIKNNNLIGRIYYHLGIIQKNAVNRSKKKDKKELLKKAKNYFKESIKYYNKNSFYELSQFVRPGYGYESKQKKYFRLLDKAIYWNCQEAINERASLFIEDGMYLNALSILTKINDYNLEGDFLQAKCFEALNKNEAIKCLDYISRNTVCLDHISSNDLSQNDFKQALLIYEARCEYAGYIIANFDSIEIVFKSITFVVNSSNSGNRIAETTDISEYFFLLLYPVKKLKAEITNDILLKQKIYDLKNAATLWILAFINKIYQIGGKANVENLAYAINNKSYDHNFIEELKVYKNGKSLEDDLKNIIEKNCFYPGFYYYCVYSHSKDKKNLKYFTLAINNGNQRALAISHFNSFLNEKFSDFSILHPEARKSFNGFLENSKENIAAKSHLFSLIEKSNSPDHLFDYGCSLLNSEYLNSNILQNIFWCGAQMGHLLSIKIFDVIKSENNKNFSVNNIKAAIMQINQSAKDA